MIVWKCKDCNWVNIQLGDPSEPKPELKPCTACAVYEAERDLCEHKEFKNSVCESCGFKCEHQEMDDGHCLDCGEFLLGDMEPDEAWLESQKDRV